MHLEQVRAKLAAHINKCKIRLSSNSVVPADLKASQALCLVASLAMHNSFLDKTRVASSARWGSISKILAPRQPLLLRQHFLAGCICLRCNKTKLIKHLPSLAAQIKA